MEERRRAKRFKEENEVSINIVSREEIYSKEKIPYHCSKDISESGIKIHGNILLPVGSLLNIDIILKNLHQKITTLGKVKWNHVIIPNESYEAGVEFIPETI